MKVCGWLFFGWAAGLQVLLAGTVILLVEYDPAGGNCLASPFSSSLSERTHAPLCSFASPDNSQECISACTPLLRVSMQPLSLRL